MIVRLKALRQQANSWSRFYLDTHLALKLVQWGMLKLVKDNRCLIAGAIIQAPEFLYLEQYDFN